MKSNSLWKIPLTISSSCYLITLSYSGKTQISVCLTIAKCAKSFFFSSSSFLSFLMLAPLPPVGLAGFHPRHWCQLSLLHFFFILIHFFLRLFFSLFISYNQFHLLLHLSQLCVCGLLLISWDTCVSTFIVMWLFPLCIYMYFTILIYCGEDSRYACLHLV